MNLLVREPRSNRVTLPLGIVGIVVGIAACAASQPPLPAVTPPSSVAQVVPERVGATLMQPSDQAVVPAVATESNGPGPVADAQLASLDDAHLVAVIQAVDDRAVRIARVEEKRGEDRDVKRFARELMATHVEATNRFEAWLGQLGIEPASGPISEQVSKEVEAWLAPMRSASGKELDRLYVDRQAQELARALDLVVRAAGHVTRPELRAAIDGLRATLERNARGARDIRDALLSGKTGWRPDAYDPDKVQR